MYNLHQKSLNFSLLLRSLLLLAGCFFVITCSAYSRSFHEKRKMQELPCLSGSGQVLTSYRKVLVADIPDDRNDLFQNASFDLENGDFDHSFRKINYLFLSGIRPYPITPYLFRHGGIEHLPYYLLYKKPKLYTSI